MFIILQLYKCIIKMVRSNERQKVHNNGYNQTGAVLDRFTHLMTSNAALSSPV